MSKAPINNTKTELTLQWWQSPLQARALFALVFTTGIFLDAKSPLFPLLQKKAAQGVKIRMVLDNRDFYKEPARQSEWVDMLQTLKESNIEFVTSGYNDVSQYHAFPGSYLHRKLVIVDQHSFYVAAFFAICLQRGPCGFYKILEKCETHEDFT